MTLAKTSSVRDPHVKAEHVFKFGFNSTVGSTAETVWLQGGAYNWLAAATAMNVTSTSVADDVGSTGATAVMVEGLDADYIEVSELVVMDGQTIVETDTEFLRVHRAYVDTAGTGGVNAGTIYVFTGTETDGVPATATQIYSTIGPNTGQTLQALYTVPAGHTAYIYSFQTSSYGNANNFATVDLRFRYAGGPWRVQDRVIVSRGIIRIPHDIPLFFQEKSDIEIIGASDGSTVDLSASFDLILDAAVNGS